MVMHEDFTVDSSTCTYVYTDAQKKKVTLVWNSVKAGQYTLKISSKNGTGQRYYSLYNICLQNRKADVNVVVKSGTNVVFYDPKFNALAQSGSYVIRMTDIIGGGDEHPDESNIYFLGFDSDDCELLITSKRAMISPLMLWTGAALTSHDNLPEPPVSGAEN